MAKRAGKKASQPKRGSAGSRAADAGKSGAGKASAGRTRKARTSRTRGADDESSREANALSDAEAREALEASDKIYYRIGEVSRLTGVKAHVLRYWETEFRWMAPPKSRSKQRLYRKRDIEFVWLLKKLLWDERYTIAGARQRIQELGVDDALALLSPETPRVTGADAAVVPDAKAAGDGDPSTRSAAEWVAFRAALDEMQNDLLALRGVLQDGS